MFITLSPARADAVLSLERKGETLIVDGLAFDLSPLAEGATLPQWAVGCPALAGDITRQGGALHLTLRLPHGPEAPPEVLFPALLAGPADGPVALPGQPAGPVPATGPGAIDWAAVITPSDRLSAARAGGRRRMLAWIEGYLSRFTDGVPVAEMQSWPVKAERARAHLAKPPEPTLVIEATVLGEDPDDLARKILEKAELFARVTAAVTGLRRATERAIDAATTAEGIETALHEALARVQSLEEVVGASGNETADGS